MSPSEHDRQRRLVLASLAYYPPRPRPSITDERPLAQPPIRR